MVTMIARLNEIVDRTAPGPPVADLVGFDLVSVGGGRAEIELAAGPRHFNPMGTVPGGILCDIADAAMGTAYASTLGDGESFTTIELKINFLCPVIEAKLSASARVVKGGRTMGFVECDITDDSGALVARASSTCLTLRPA